MGRFYFNFVDLDNSFSLKDWRKKGQKDFFGGKRASGWENPGTTHEQILLFVTVCPRPPTWHRTPPTPTLHCHVMGRGARLVGLPPPDQILDPFLLFSSSPTRGPRQKLDPLCGRHVGDTLSADTTNCEKKSFKNPKFPNTGEQFSFVKFCGFGKKFFKLFTPTPIHSRAVALDVVKEPKCPHKSTWEQIVSFSKWEKCQNTFTWVRKGNLAKQNFLQLINFLVMACSPWCRNAKKHSVLCHLSKNNTEKSHWWQRHSSAIKFNKNLERINLEGTKMPPWISRLKTLRDLWGTWKRVRNSSVVNWCGKSSVWCWN